MSQFFDLASMVLVPSGYRDGKLYSQKPLSTDGELTFSRGSDIEATRVGSDGYIEKAKVNLLIRSNQFDTSWLSSGTTETGGQAGYDGTNDAWLLQRSDGLSRFVYQLTPHTGVGTFSVYIKKGNVDWALLSSGTGDNRYFDLANGVLGATGTAIDSKIESVGGDWYRCSIAVANSSEFRIYPAVANNQVSGLVGANIYIQDAQANYGLVAQEYQETTTTSVVAGITNDMPRLDYSGGASCPSLKLEPSRSNLIPHSEYIDDSGWTKSNATITTNSATSAEGVQNASLVTFGSGGYILESVTTTKTIGSTETISVFSNADISGTFLKYGGGTAAGTDVEGREVIGNGWFRYYVTRTFTEAETGSTQLLIAQSDVGDSVLIYGAQLEVGSYPTSYIPTYGTSATRTADAAYNTALNAPLSGGYTVFIEMETKSLTEYNQFQFRQETPSILYALRIGSGINVGSSVYTSSNTLGTNKYALSVQSSGAWSLYKNGTQLSSGTGITANLQSLRNDATGYDIDQILVFKSALTASQLAELTTL
jgi:hypothetical protein